MKTKNPIEIIGSRHQSDLITTEKIQLILEYGADPENARFFLTLIRLRDIELISDGNKFFEVRVI